MARAIERLQHPIPGGKVEAAKAFGVDVTLTIEQLKLSPADACIGAGRRVSAWYSPRA